MFNFVQTCEFIGKKVWSWSLTSFKVYVGRWQIITHLNWEVDSLLHSPPSSWSSSTLSLMSLTQPTNTSVTRFLGPTAAQWSIGRFLPQGAEGLCGLEVTFQVAIPYSLLCSCFSFMTLFPSSLQISVVCRPSWTRCPGWVSMCRSRGWTATWAGSSMTSSTPCAQRSSTGTATLYEGPCCSWALEARRFSSTRYGNTEDL